MWMYIYVCGFRCVYIYIYVRENLRKKKHHTTAMKNVKTT